MLVQYVMFKAHFRVSEDKNKWKLENIAEVGFRPHLIDVWSRPGETKISKSGYGMDWYTWKEAHFDADSNGENRFKIGWMVQELFTKNHLKVSLKDFN
jgi:hypothetical protein